MRVLVVSNMWPSDHDPAFGTFVAAQVRSLQELEDLDVRVFEFDARGRPWRYLTSAWALRRQVRRFAPDVVHAHFGLTFVPVVLAGARRRGRTQTVLTVHGTDVDHAKVGRVTAWCARRADLVIAVSAALRDRLIAASGPLAQTAVAPCGVDMALRTIEDRPTARGILGLPPDDTVLLLPADPVRPEKRGDLARQVATALPAHLLDYSGGIDAQELRRRINASDCVLVTSDREGFGLGMLDALACGTPVIARPVGAAHELLDDAPGCSVLDFDVTTWTEAVRAARSVASDAATRTALRECARPYSLQEIARRIRRLYYELAAPGDAASM